MLDKKLLQILVCPVTKAPLDYDESAQELVCKASGLAYPVRDGIPVLLEGEARVLTADEKLGVSQMEDTIFGKITRGEIPTDFLYQDEQCVVIKDIYPQAPTHVLIIPRKPIPMLAAADENDQSLLGHLLVVAGKVAKQLGVDDAFRLVINNGEGGGQTVFHLHLHILAGRDMKEGELAQGLSQ